MNNLKRFLKISIFLAMVFGFTTTALADSMPYFSYSYDEWDNPQAAPSGYEPSLEITGNSLRVGDFSEPTDIFSAENKKLYILDSKNARVVVTNHDFTNAYAIDEFSQNGILTTISNATGLFVNSIGEIYISDSDNHRIIVCNDKGEINRVYEKPTTDLFPNNTDFIPQKIVVDAAGTIYVSCKGVYNGAVMLSQEGDFLGFFGANRIKVTAAVITEKVWKTILNDDQKEGLAKYVPVEITGLAVDKDNFVYSCTANSDDYLNLIRRINPAGKNILEVKASMAFPKGFGDFKPYVENEKMIRTNLVDIAVAPSGQFAAIDFTTGRVFQYDNDANLICIYGGLGNVKGLFKQPIAIEFLNDEQVVVLDKASNSLTLYTVSEYGSYLSNAIKLYNDGLYVQSLAYWEKVNNRSAYYNLANIGLGKAYLELGDFSKAMEHFTQGSDRRGYNLAFIEYRSDFLRANFIWFFCLAMLLTVFAFRKKIPVLHSLDNKLAQKLSKYDESTSSPFNIMKKPLSGFEDMFYYKSAKLSNALAICLALFIGATIQFQYTSFLFNLNDLKKINILLILASTIGAAVLFSVINWAICTLFNGKGRFVDIFISVSYAALPFTISQFLVTALSYLVSDNEAIFVQYITIIAVAWSLLLLIKGIEACHQYTLKQTIASILFTLVGIFIALFIGILMLSLSQQLVGFIVSVSKELMLR